LTYFFALAVIEAELFELHVISTFLDLEPTAPKLTMLGHVHDLLVGAIEHLWIKLLPQILVFELQRNEVFQTPRPMGHVFGIELTNQLSLLLDEGELKVELLIARDIEGSLILCQTRRDDLLRLLGIETATLPHLSEHLGIILLHLDLHELVVGFDLHLDA
jgi:hypothetical protein